ncbi:MAG: hypothetical protein JXQ23_13430 [Clostridia bacterium]|nr:hypothetical protein [Clostridia bacterium]
MEFIEIILTIIPLVIAISLGYLLTKSGFLKANYIDAFKKIVVNITLPAGLLVAFSSIQFKVKYIIIFAAVFVTCYILLLIGKLIAGIFKVKSPYFPYLLTGFEAGMMGYALYGGLYGMDKISEFGIIDIGQVTFVFLILVPAVLSIGKEKSDESRVIASLKTAVNSPVIWAIIIGLLLSVAGIYQYENTTLFKGLLNIFNFLSAPTSLLICFIIGSGLKLSVKGMKKEVMTAFLKVLMAFIFALLLKVTLLRILGVEAMLSRALVSMFILPAPFVIPVFMSRQNESDINYVSNTLSIGTIVGLLLFILLALLNFQ